MEFVAVVQSVQAKISVKDFSNLIPCWSCKQSDFFILMLTTIFVSLTRLTGIVEGSRIACTKTEIIEFIMMIKHILKNIGNVPEKK